MAPAAVVDLRAARVAAALDRLAALGRAGVDVHALLTRSPSPSGAPMSDPGHATSVRLSPAMLARLDALVGDLEGSPVAVAAGGRWGRSTALRLAVDAGLTALRSPDAGGVRALEPAPAVVTLEGTAPGPGLRRLYRLVTWCTSSGMGVAWPDGRWSMDGLPPPPDDEPPSAEGLEARGLKRADAEAVAYILAAGWDRVAG
jgi:hypothetical protein